MTDNEIIKAYKTCKEDTTCEHCPYSEVWDGSSACIDKMFEDTIDLIKRQKAEIERLEKIVDELRADHKALGDVFSNELVACHDCHLKYEEKINQHKAEAIKEFAERLKKFAFDCDVSFGYGREHYTEAVAVIEIDNLVKEMVGEEK